MTLAELLAATRLILDDGVTPYLFSDEEITRHLNAAIDEACIRTRVLQASTGPLCAVDIVAGQPRYMIDPSILAVRRARVAGQFDPLDRLDVSQLDQQYRGWDDPSLAQRGTPRAIAFDAGTHELVLVPTPYAAGTLHLLIWRLPIEDERLDQNDTSGEPALPQHMHRELVHWAAAQCALNQDAEQANPNLAATQMALFEAAYGDKPSLHAIRLWSTNHRTRLRAHFD